MTSELNGLNPKEWGCEGCHYPNCTCDLKCKTCSWIGEWCQSVMNIIDDLTVSIAEYSKLMESMDKHREELNTSLDYLNGLFK